MRPVVGASTAHRLEWDALVFPQSRSNRGRTTCLLGSLDVAPFAALARARSREMVYPASPFAYAFFGVGRAQGGWGGAMRAEKVGPPRVEGLAEELSQAKARLGVCCFALVYMGVWTLTAEPVATLTVMAVGLYGVISLAWLVWIRRTHHGVRWRRHLIILGDLGINTFFMHSLQEKGAFFYPMYLWIIVGNGMRFGARPLLVAMGVGVAYFAPMLYWSPYWRANAVAGSGLLAGLVILPLFYLSLIRRLHETNSRLAQEVERSGLAERAKAQFLANMSHELRTPMTGVLGVVELLEGTDPTPKQTEYLDLIGRSGRSLLTIIDDILDLSRVEAGRVELVDEVVDLRAMTHEVLDLLRPSADAKGLELSLLCPADLPHRFRGDPTRLRQILFNLVGNAIKFTQEGKIEVEIAHDLPLQGMIHFRLHDTGVGIPPEKLEHIFEKFGQAESQADRRFGGSGLGLTISRQLARAMGGDIAVSSRVGEGTTFECSLPLPHHPSASQLDRGEEPGGTR